MINISACIITNNNPMVIKAIESVYDSVSEIILVNTCKEFTVDIFKFDKVRLFQFDWNDSFSDARNYGIEKAKGDWILVIDSDEVANEKIIYLDPKYDLYFAKVYNGNVPYDTLRIFKNNGMRYQWKLHESVEQYVTKDNTSYSDLTITHSGCQITGEELRQKVNRNLRIMLTDYGNPVRNFHLGLYYMYRENYKKAIEYFLNVLNDEVNNEHKAHACNNAFRCFIELGTVQIDLIRQSLQYFPMQRFARLELVGSMLGTFKTYPDLKLKELILTELEKIKTIDSRLNNDIALDLHFINEKQKEIQQWHFQ